MRNWSRLPALVTTLLLIGAACVEPPPPRVTPTLNSAMPEGCVETPEGWDFDRACPPEGFERTAVHAHTAARQMVEIRGCLPGAEPNPGMFSGEPFWVVTCIAESGVAVEVFVDDATGDVTDILPAPEE